MRFNLRLFAFSVLAVAISGLLSSRTPQFRAAEKPAGESEWKPLFNGKNIDDWTIVVRGKKVGKDPDKIVQVEDGVIHLFKDQVAGTPGSVGYFAPKEVFSYYHLRFQYKWGTKKFQPRMKNVRDAGFLYHMGPEDQVWPQCVECQVQEGDTGDCWLVHGTGIDTTATKKAPTDRDAYHKPAKEGGEAMSLKDEEIMRVYKNGTNEIDGWNTVEVIVKGDKEVSHIVNGKELFHGTNLKKYNAETKKWEPLDHGRISFQLEFAEVYYRNIEIRPIKDGPLLYVEKKTSAVEKTPAEKAPAAPKPKPIITTKDRPQSAAVKSLQVPAGFEVVEIAGPPLVDYPMLACFDEQGRLYVSEGANVNDHFDVLIKTLPRSIKRLEDTDGDGIFDKSIVFADKMTFPFGGVFHDGALYVASDPSVWRLEDTDGDGVADKREEFVGRFGSGGLASSMKGAFLGLDGRIYFNGGNEGFGANLTGKDGTRLKSNNSAPSVFRIRDDGRELEYFANGASGLYDLVFHPSGDIFGVTTIMVGPRGDGIMHWVYGGQQLSVKKMSDISRYTGKSLPPMIMWGQSSPSSPALYSSDVFGEEYRGNLFTAHFNHHLVSGVNAVTRNVIERNGGTWKSTLEEKFIQTADQNCRFTDVIEDADGSLVVINTGGWFRIGCPTAQTGEGPLTGAIYRVRKIGQKSPADPRGLKIDWQNISDDELAKLLDDARPAVRERTMATFAKRGDKSVAALKTALQSKSSALRCNAVWALTRIDSPAARDAVRPALTDADHNTRQAALQSVGLWRDAKAYDQIVKTLQLSDTVDRRNAATALGRFGDKAAVPVLFSALAKNDDRFVEHSLIYALLELNDVPALTAGLKLENAKSVRGALFVLDQLDNGNLTEKDLAEMLKTRDSGVQRSVLEVFGRHGRWLNGVPEICAKWLHDPKLSEENRAVLSETLKNKIRHFEIQKLIGVTLAEPETTAEVRGLLLDAIAGSRYAERIPESWSQGFLACLNSKDVKTIEMTIEVISSLKITKLSDDLQKFALDEKNSLPLRIEAAEASFLGDKAPDDKLFDQLTEKLSDENTDLLTKYSIAKALGGAKFSESQLERLLVVITTAPPIVLPQLLRAFEDAASPVSGEKLANALLKSPGISMASHFRVEKLLDRYADLDEKLCSSVRSKLSNVDAKQAARIAELTKLSAAKGNPQHGYTVFFGSGSCSHCHRINNAGGKVGPDLSEVAKAKSPRDIVEAISFPSSTLARGFEPVSITTGDGKSLSGIINRITSKEVYISTSDRTQKRVPRDEVEGLDPSSMSLMPQGFDRALQPQDFLDVVAFLSTLKGEQQTGK